MSNYPIIKMSFDIDVAKKIDTDAAIILENIRFWCAKNSANEKHFYQGRYWTYNSVKAFEKLFSWLSYDQIRRRLDRLEEHGYITSGEFNSHKYDRTKWYSVELANLPNEAGTVAKPIPDNKPDNKQKENIKRKSNDYQSRYEELIAWWNKKQKTRWKATDNNLNNFKYWADVYEDWEIKAAILISYKHPWWSDKVNPTRLFRRYSTEKDPIDYIGQLLNYRSSDPLVMRVKKGMQEMEEKSNGK